jgi:hypothetical protein
MKRFFLLGGSLIVSPIFFYIGVIRNSKEYFNSDAAIHKEVKYIFDDDKLTLNLMTATRELVNGKI